MRLIDADALSKVLDNIDERYGIDSCGEGIHLCMIAVAKAPTIIDCGEIDHETLGKIPYMDLRPKKWIPCTERLPEENICDDGYVEPSDYVLVFGDHGNYGVSRYWGNRKTKKENPLSYIFSDWMDLNWNVQRPIAWMPLPEPYKEGDSE